MSSQSPTPEIIVDSQDFWTFVQEGRDSDEVCEAIGDNAHLVSLYATFVALNVTIDRFQRLISRTRREMNEVFEGLTTPEFIRRTSPFIRRKNAERTHPYTRRPASSFGGSPTSSSTTSQFGTPESSPRRRFEHLVITTPVTTSPLWGSREFPIDVDADTHESPPEENRPDTPHPEHGTLPGQSQTIRCNYCGQQGHLRAYCLDFEEYLVDLEIRASAARNRVIREAEERTRRLEATWPNYPQD